MNIFRHLGLTTALLGLPIVFFPSKILASEFLLSSQINPSLVNPVEVVLFDSAGDSCWTNFSEAKTYAENELRKLGYEIGTTSANKFVIFVNSVRNNVVGLCFGQVEVTLRKGAEVGGIKGWLILGNSSIVFTRAQNADSLVLVAIESLTDAMMATAIETEADTPPIEPVAKP